MTTASFKKINSSLELSDEDLKLVESRKRKFLKGELKIISLEDIRKKAYKHLNIKNQS